MPTERLQDTRSAKSGLATSPQHGNVRLEAPVRAHRPLQSLNKGPFEVKLVDGASMERGQREVRMSLSVPHWYAYCDAERVLVRHGSDLQAASGLVVAQPAPARALPSHAQGKGA